MRYSVTLRTTFFALLFSLVSCNGGTGETVETAYLEPLPPEPRYSFSRAGISSVDIQECRFLAVPLQYIYTGFLQSARLTGSTQFELMLPYFEESQTGIIPVKQLAASSYAKGFRKDVVADFYALFHSSAAIAGFGTSQPSETRNREASRGRSGYIGSDITDPNLIFVDAQGRVLAEIYRYYLLGAIHLDKVLNLHLSDSLYTDSALIARHQNIVLPPGRNYTELEHHWDLAYGYYDTFWKPLAQADGLPILKDSHRRIFESFVYGRTAMKTFDYTETRRRLVDIRTELSRVAVIRTMNLLLGVNTLVNIEEAPEYAFSFLSQAIGLIYALQFLPDAKGQPIFSRNDVLRLIADLTLEGGLWNRERLLGTASTSGSLLNVAERIGRPMGILPTDIKR